MQDRALQIPPEPEQPASCPAISSQEVEAELEKILASPLFSRAPRHSRFLEFVVRKKLAGLTECVKESLIGVEVFGRSPDYDPGSEPAVRVEAGRLRARLAEYYKDLGRHDPIQIYLPKGTYVPVFSRNGVTPPLEEISEAGPVADASPSEKIIVARGDRYWRRWLAAAAVVILAIVVVTYSVSRPRARFSEKDSIVLADFDNNAGDAVFDDTLKQGLSVQLEQSPFVGLVSERKVNDTLKLMGRSAGDRLTPEVTREVCLRTASTAMLTGAIARLGSQYVIGLTVVSCDSGDVLAQTQEQAASKEAVLKALDAGAASLRSKLGESLSSVQKYATPLAEATTPSLEALKAYSQGHKTALTQGENAALPFYKRAVELDPNFAVAYNAMATAYYNLNEVGRSAENARKAYELREKVSDRERFSIEAHYYLDATGELEKAAQVYELWQQTYPRDATPYVNLGFVYGNLGNFEKALDEARGTILLEPNDWANYNNLGISYANLNRLDEAEAAYKEAGDRQLQGEFLLQNRYVLAFLKGDSEQMARMAAAATGKPGTEDLLLARQADTEAWYGRSRNARALTGRAMDSAEHNDAKETAAAYQAFGALREVELGNREQARADADAAVKMAPTRDVKAMAALALARAGDNATSEKLAAELDKAFPLDTLAQRYWLPTIRASVALSRKDPRRAVKLLETMGAIELGSTGNLEPAYVRGEAYLMLRDGKAAAGEFRKFIDHYGFVGNFPWGALARLGLARAYALEAQTDPAARDKARSAYQNFLTLWNDADPDIPIYRQAKAEYARLQ